MNVKRYLVTLAATGICLTALLAQSGPPPVPTHYPAGVEGLKAATLPPPGLYLRDYNYLYSSDDFPGGPPDFDVFAYIQAPRLIWISPYKVFGGYYGADILVPFVYQDVSVGPMEWSEFDIGDVFVEPITLSWHLPRWDVGIGYGFWAPTGESGVDPASPGRGYWGNMFTAGATYYPDKEKTWSVSILNRYEVNLEDTQTDIRPGQAWTLEWGAGKTFRKTIDVGLIGYFQKQTTEEKAYGTIPASNAKAWTVGVGPELNWVFPKIMLFTSLRYIYEIESNHRPEGHTINLTITKRF